MPKAMRIAVIVQQGVFRASLCAALEHYPDVDVFGVPTIPERSFPVEPDIAIIDLDFQPDNHRELLRRLLAVAPNAKTCIISFRAVPATVRQCLSLGASGFLLKECTIEELYRAARMVTAGEIAVDPRLAGSLLKGGEPERIDRDFAIMLHNWALHPGTYRPDPAVMVDFDLWTFNSKVYPATAPIVVRRGDRIRIRVGNLSMWNHPIHIHGHKLWITGSDGDRWPRSAWRSEVTEIVGVGQMRDFEFVADNPGDWAMHCYMAHHTMNAMGHTIPNPNGVDQSGVERKIRSMLPGYVAMGRSGMSEHAEHLAMGLPGPENTLPMMTGNGPDGAIEMGGMFTVLKVRSGRGAHN